MLLGSQLVRRFFFTLVTIIVLFALAIYFYSVPLIKNTVYDIERNASRIALNNVFELANKIQFNLEGYRQQAVESHKKQLRTVVGFAESYAKDYFERAARGEMAEAEARRRVFEGLRKFTYGNNDYIWIAGYDTVLVSHPDTRFHGADTTEVLSHDGEQIIANIVDFARSNGDGYYQYPWQRLDQTEVVDKMSYVKDFPQWGFVIGSGVYLDDIDAEVRQRKQQAMTELRQALEEIRIAKTGYMYIFDAGGNMLIHPNANLDGINFLDQLNPVTGKSIARELIAVADTGREHFYKWDKPSDPGNYVYEKLSLVRYLDGFNWYIGSSVYVDELQRSSEVLSERIMTITAVVLVMAIFMALVFVSRIAAPIRKLADTAERVSGGDLSAQSGIRGDDEIGVLAHTFDEMVRRLSTSIQTLDHKVQVRTRELATIEEQQRMILDALPAQIAYVGRDFRYRFVNQRYAEMFGFSKDEVVGKTLEEVMGREMLDHISPQIDQTLCGEETTFEYSFRRGDRELITKRNLIPQVSSDGFVTGILNLSLDITTEKETERKLTEAQRMGAVGQLAGGLAHDFNNLLTVIIGNLISLCERHQGNAELERYLEPAIRASRRGADITSRLLAFSRKQPLQPTAVDVVALVQEGIELLKGGLPSNIDIEFDPDDVECRAYVDASQLENVLFNLSLNARDAMPKGGTLQVTLRERWVQVPLDYDEAVVPGDYLEIRVKDTGVGFSEEGLSRAFEPFFTTKGGAGSGLGLSMVYGFVKQSQGYIRLDSAPGKGAEVRMLLPAVPANYVADDGMNGTMLGSGSGDGRLVLLVEDDADVRNIIREQLSDMGYAVVEACDGDEASTLLESLPGLYAVVSDVIMPGQTDGFELAAQVNREHPEVHVVLITGYSFEQQSRGSSGARYELLRKPFAPEALKSALDQSGKRKKEQGNPSA
ncbi:cache domain-containing protein [Motiliproteus sediminis]|uniref:cache domain-containing protein n=1 Tax=Motiliproteus sediminis TaxID=1468178 RepID=UPI001AEFB76D|nr:cache domain-containing protein [Motiliproteus sediminis]